MNPDAVPLPGPFDTWPDVPAELAFDQLMTSIQDIPFGAADAVALHWLQGEATSVLPVLASWLRRAWTAGLEAGRAEATETPAAPAAPDDLPPAAPARKGDL